MPTSSCYNTAAFAVYQPEIACYYWWRTLGAHAKKNSSIGSIASADFGYHQCSMLPYKSQHWCHLAWCGHPHIQCVCSSSPSFHFWHEIRYRNHMSRTSILLLNITQRYQFFVMLVTINKQLKGHYIFVYCHVNKTVCVMLVTINKQLKVHYMFVYCHVNKTVCTIQHFIPKIPTVSHSVIKAYITKLRR